MKRLAREIMNREVICVSKDLDLRDLAKLFLDKGITGAPVLDEKGELVGVVSQTDLLYYQLTRGDELVAQSDYYANVKVEGGHLPRGFQVEDFNTGTVFDVMTPVVHSVLESADVETVARMMVRRHIHRVIVRSGRKVSGIISALDLLRFFTRGAATSGAPEKGRRGSPRRTSRTGGAARRRA